MIIQATIKYFNLRQFEETGRSFGFASSPQHGTIFVGTDFRVWPEILGNEVVLGEPRNCFYSTQVKEGDEIMIDVVRNRNGLSGRWCLKTTWDTACADLKDIMATREEQRREEEQLNKLLEAEERRRAETNPRSLEEALRNGWQIQPGSDTGRQVIVTRKNASGKNMTHTFYRPKSTHRVSRPRLPQFA